MFNLHWCVQEAYFYKLKKTCLSPQKSVNPRALDVRSLATPTNPRPSTEWDTMIEKLDKDRFFDIKSDEVIIQIGKHISSPSVIMVINNYSVIIISHSREALSQYR